jgi:hypothetical protein
MPRNRLATGLGVAMVMASGLFALPALAGVIINITQDTNGVVATGSGTIDLAGLTIVSGFTASPQMNPSVAFIELGPDGNTLAYSSASGPSNFGPGLLTGASSGSGDIFGVSGSLIGVPEPYISGTTLSGSATWGGGATFSSLGLTVGTYTWRWGSGADADSLVINIGTPVPEPVSLALLSTGLLGLMGCAVVRRKR